MTSNVTVKFGYAIPAGPTTSRYGYIFKGWYDGTGVKYFDENGSPLSEVWTKAKDVTVYPRWERNEQEPLDNVTLYVNDNPVREGASDSGDGWNYDSETGFIYLTGAGKTYDIRGTDTVGFAQIEIRANCTMRVSRQLKMEPGTRANYNPVRVAPGVSATLDVTDAAVGSEAECLLTGADGCTAIRVPSTSSLLVKTTAPLYPNGGDGAADMGVDRADGDGGKIYVETYSHWGALIRPVHGSDKNNGLLNASGKGAAYYSHPASNRVWSVRMTDLGIDESEKRMYLQRVADDIHDDLHPDVNGKAWLWMPAGGYEWAGKLNASESTDSLWDCYVNSCHSVADFYAPLQIEIDGEDIAHLTGPGWCVTYENTSSESESKKATLIILDAGPHTITGYGNAGVELTCDTSLTISNLMLNVASWDRKSAFYLLDNVDLDLRIEGTNRLTSAADCAGIFVAGSNTLTIDGDGELKVSGGAYAAGIGGSHETKSKSKNGKITINGGVITAVGGSNAAGIGSGYTSEKGGDITINGGKVTVRGGQYAAAIGGGYTGCANVTVNSGSVFPTAGSKAYAIGAGYSASGSSANRFNLSAIYSTSAKVSPAAKNSAGKAVFPVTFDMGMHDCLVTGIVIDSADKTFKDIWTDESGNLTLWLEPTGGDIVTVTITAVDATGTETKKSWGYRMDDDGSYEFSRDILTVDGSPVVGGKDSSGSGWSYNHSTKALVFTTGSHTVSGNSTNGTIRLVAKGGDIALNLEQLTLGTASSYLSPFVVSNRCTITLVGDSAIECYSNPDAKYASQAGSQYTAGVEVPEGASLVIEGDGSLTANGGIAGAGIGSRGQNLKAGSITINGGYVYATGGGGKAGGGAGVGGGNGGGVESILVTGGYLYAVGGKGAAGIGAGNNGPSLADGAFRVTGGTVVAERGAGGFSDFVTSSGGGSSVTVGKSIVIDGGSVRPKNAIQINTNPYPNPVNSNDEQLAYAIFEGLGPVDPVTIQDYLWPQYGGVEVYSDEDGCVCIWGVRTNTVRNVELQSANIEGGLMTFEVSAATNTVTSVSGGEAPDSRTVDGDTCWRVEVHALPPGKRMKVEGLDSKYVRGTVLSDYTGKTYIYLPDGEYDFTIGGYSYLASVASAPAVATYSVGILVDGVDLGMESGTGWEYDGTAERLSLLEGREYAISGTNSERSVSVCVEVPGVKVRSDRLVLKGASEGPFYLGDESSSIEFTGGTLSTGTISAKVAVSGGTFDTTLEDPVSPSGETLYRVTVSGLSRHSPVEIQDLDGTLAGYDTAGIWANEYGEVYLYLPNGDYFFKVSCNDTVQDMIAIVSDEDATALNYTATGVYIDGREAARLRGEGWRNNDGLISLNSATNYVITGTNDGAAVTFSAQLSGTTLTLDGLVMTNAHMMASAIKVGNSEKKTKFTIELCGTNILYGVESGTCGVEITGDTELAVQGDGRLEVQGASGAPGIGIVEGSTSYATFAVMSGEIAATGGENAAGVGGGSGKDGIKTRVYGGVLTAQGGANGAGIGGGSGGRGASVTVTNGVVNATGGGFAAGIGGGTGRQGDLVTVSDFGRVTATGGTDASGIGGGKGGAPGKYRQSGGTVVAVGDGNGADIGAGDGGGTDSSAYTTIFGGSLKSSSDRMTVEPKDSSGNRVYCVTIPTGRPNFDIGAVMSDYNGYLLSGIVTDDEGKIYIWLKNGKYCLNIGRVPFRAVVNGADTVAEQWVVGVEVNGEDIALQSGDGWKYELDSCKLFVSGNGCTISGSNTTDTAYVQITNDVSVIISNLVIETTSTAASGPFSVLSGASVVLSLAGSNSLASGATTMSSHGFAGINVPYGSTLTITNIDSIVSVPDLDNIHTYTNELYDIEYDEDGNPVTDEYGVVITNIIYDITVVTNYNDVTVSPFLYAKGGNSGAGIGGRPHESHGLIVIAGGTISANGHYSAGIGSGEFPSTGEYAGDATTLRQGEIRITGGVVEATGGGGGAGIGGGENHSGGQVSISGGTVTANGGSTAAGIGGGCHAYGHTIRISGGVVTALGGDSGAGIGGGSLILNSSAANTEQCKIAISGGRVSATGGKTAAGIGTGYKCGQGASVSITGGTVVATGMPDDYGRKPDDIGFGGDVDSAGKASHPLTITGASVHATRRTASSEFVSPAPSNSTERVWCVVADTGVTNELVSVKYLESFGYVWDSESGEDSEIYSDDFGKVYLWLPNGTHVFYVGNMPFTATVADADATAGTWLTGVSVDGVDVSFVKGGKNTWAYDYGTKTLGIVKDCTVTGTNTAGKVTILVEATGNKPVTISNLYLKAAADAARAPLAVTRGVVTVRLAGKNRLDASATDSHAGLSVEPYADLVLTNLEENAALEASGGAYAAGIGGGRESTVGTISICGGVIKATGGSRGGAGIGSGTTGTCGDIFISGGRIEAIGGSIQAVIAKRGAGIGGGDEANANGRRIVISGGTVKATGGSFFSSRYAADIGYGYYGEGYCSIDISGGSVHPGSDDPDRYFSESGEDRFVTPENGNGARVYEVTLDGFTADAKADFEMSGYGANDIYADSSGKIYLWLADGTYGYTTGGRRFAMKIAGGGVDTVELPDAYGVQVDGEDVVNMSGAGWAYDPFAGTLSLAGEVTLSGTNTEGKVKIVADADVTILPARLVLAASAGADVLSGAGTVTVTNGTAELTGGSSCTVKVLGGSLKFDGTAAVAFSNDTDAVQCVTVPGLTPGSPVSLSGLPDYYGTSGIYADGGGNVYLWLPETWDAGGITTHTLNSAARPRLLGAPGGTAHTFAANGYSYTVVIAPAAAAPAAAVQGAPLELAGFTINGFEVEGDVLRINVSATPDTWLYGFFDRVSIRSSATLPVAKTPETLLDTTSAEATLENDGSVTYTLDLPPDDGASRFFIVEGP